MAFKIGDRVVYDENEGNEENLHGKIVAFCNNTEDMITTYLAILDQGILVQFTSNNLKWRHVGGPVLVT